MSDSAGESSARTRPPHDGPQVLRVTGAIAAGEPLGPGEDGAADGGSRAGGPVLVLASHGGATFHLPVDGALRAALRQASTAPAPAGRAAAPEQPLRPKDIQTRIRAGESAQDLAESSGASLVQIERYAGPVLAERAHVATVARSTVVRTSRSRPTLEDLVRHRLASRGVALGSVEWDAWRRGEHGWALQVSFRAGTRDRLAQWAYDPDGESVEPLDDEARWLSASHEADSPGAGRRLSAVRVFDVESDGRVREVPVVPGPPLIGDTGPVTGTSAGLGGAATGSITGLGSGPATGSSPPVGAGADDEGPLAPWTVPDHDEVAARTMDLLDALSDRRGRRQPVPDLGPDGGWDEEDEDDDLVDALLDDLPGSHARPGDPGGDGLPVFGSLPLTPLLEPHLRSVPAPDPALEGGPDGPDDGRPDDDRARDDRLRDDRAGDDRPRDDGPRDEDGRAGAARRSRQDRDARDDAEPAGWRESPQAERAATLGLVPPLAEPPAPRAPGAEPWTPGGPTSSRDLLSVREGRIGRADAGELQLADTGEMSPAQLRELHERSSGALPADREEPVPSERGGRGARRDGREGGADADAGGSDAGAGPDGGEGGPAGGDAQDEAAGRPASRPRTTRRPSVPSWDEIVFGSPRTDSD